LGVPKEDKKTFLLGFEMILDREQEKAAAKAEEVKSKT